MTRTYLKMVSVDKGDTIYTIQEWFENGNHLWSEYDGDGYWAIKGFYSGLPVHQSECPAWATHVVWFNK